MYKTVKQKVAVALIYFNPQICLIKEGGQKLNERRPLFGQKGTK